MSKRREFIKKSSLSLLGISILPKTIFAKKEKLGLWSGTFMMPWDYRKKN